MLTDQYESYRGFCEDCNLETKVYDTANGELCKSCLADHTNKPTRTWNCKKCGRLVERYRGMNDVQCECGAWYNSFGQRLRDDWQGNPSNYDEDISDLEGYERQYAGDE